MEKNFEIFVAAQLKIASDLLCQFVQIFLNNKKMKNETKQIYFFKVTTKLKST